MYDPSGKRVGTLKKKELLAVIFERKLAEKDSGVESLTKPQLMEMIGEETCQGKGVHSIKLIGLKLYPQAMCSFQGSLYLFDGASGGVWKVTLTFQAGRVTGIPTLLFNLPQQTRVMSLACRSDGVYVACRSENSGLYHYSYATEQLKCVLVSSDQLTISYIACNESTIVFSDTDHGVVYNVKDGQSFPLSGIAQHSQELSSTDGFSSLCHHAQPSALCLEGNTIYVCDKASVSIRIISDLKPLLKYHGTISKVYEAFTIHSGSHGYRAPLTPSVALDKLSAACSVFHEMLDGVRSAYGEPNLKPNGPQGSLPYVTIDMFDDLWSSTNKLVKLLQSNSAIDTLSMQSMLSVPCEHHFATMRSRYQMPTLLQYCDLLNTVVEEQIKRSTTSSFIYYTNKKSYYPQPELQAVSKVISKRQKKNKKCQKIKRDDKRLMLNWRKDYCAGR